LDTRKRKTKLIKKTIGRLLQWLLVAVLGLLVSTFMVLQLPHVQNRLFGNFLRHLSCATQFSITHQRFQFKWLRHASLTGLVIKDPQDNLIVAADQLAVKINPLQLLTDMRIMLKTVCIQDAQVHLYKEGEEPYSVNVLLQRLAGTIKPVPDTQQALEFVIESASIHNMILSVDDKQATPLQGVFDIQHFTIYNVDAELANLKVQARTLAVDIRHLTGRHAGSPLFVDHLSTLLAVTPDRIQCETLQLQTACSTLEGNCTLAYDALMPPEAFKDHVYLTACFNNVLVTAEDLAVFIPYFKRHKASYTLSGALEGKLNDLRMLNLQLGFGKKGSHFKSCLSLKGLLDVQEAVFCMELQQSSLHTQDLLPYLDEKHYNLIEPFDLVKTKGRFRGTLSHFMAQATFDTSLGKIATDLEIQIDLASERTTYKGTIATSNFELGAWLNNPAVQQLTMDGQIDGVGLSLATVHVKLEARISKLGVNDYTYEHIYANGDLARTFFQGQLTVDDPHLKLRADAFVNLNRGTESITVKGVLDRACLQALQLTDRRATLSTQLSIATQGLSWNDIKADATLHQFCFDLEGKEIRLDALHVHADRGDFGRLLEIDSALFAFKAEGNFSYPILASDLNQFIQGYQRCLMQQELPTPRYSPEPYTLTYQLQCRDLTPLIRIFGIDAHVSPNTQLKGSFSQQSEAVFSLQLSEASSLAFKKNRWGGTQLALSAHQSKDGQEVSALVQLVSKEQQWKRLNTTEDLVLSISWQNDQIAFSGNFAQQESPHRITLQGQAALSDSAIEIVLIPTQGVQDDNQWHVHPKNRMTLGRSRIQFQNFTFYKGQQQISLVGVLSAEPAEALHLAIKDYALGTRNPLGNQPITGVLNATVALQGTFDQLRMNGDITLEKLTIDHVLIGNIHGKTHWDNVLQRINLTCQIDSLNRQTVAIQGFYEPLKEADNLQLIARFSRTQLASLEPLVASHVSQLSGELNGTVHIHGSPTNPRITGELKMTDAAMRINYFNMLYQASGVFTFTDQAVITALHLSDNRQGKAALQGSITYSETEGFKIDTTGNITNLRLLNTASKDNKYFYGTGILSGSLSASGPLNNMVVCLTAKTDPGTHLIIPVLKGRDLSAQYDFIRFVNMKAQYQDKAKQTKQVTLKGFKLILLLEITPDAHTELILATKTGDTIKGRGKGNIKLEVGMQRVRSMTGEFEFLEGEYTLSLYRIVNRTFKILPESKITWYGSPTKGILNIKAVYEQRAALASLLESSAVDVKNRNKYPVQVLVGLQGALLSPEKSFSIDFLEYPGELAGVVDEFKGTAKQNKEYLETQVLSLLLLKEFTHKELPAVSSKTLRKNFSALASQQLRNFTSKINDNLEIDIDIDLATLGSQNLDTLHLDLSYKLTDKLRVSRKGGIFGAKDDVSSTARLVGDWTVEYVLTKDGGLKAKLYNKYIANASHMDAEGTTMFLGGGSLLYTKRFNRWRELVRGSERTAKKRAKK
jgi:TamB, inner membrane protein subunit of TAM complex